VDKKTAVRIDKEIQNHLQEIIKTRRYLHMNPELGNREFDTSKLVASKLLSMGLSIQTGVAKTGVVGILKGKSEEITIGVRADMDALPIQEKTGLPYQSLNPGVMHACGHDIHTAVVLGTARVLTQMKDQIKGNIKFIFQPAEEGPPPNEDGGASLMIREGVLENPPVRAIFGLHVWPEAQVGQVMFSGGPIMAGADTFTMTIKGRSAHGARPQEGIDSIFLAGQAMMGIQAGLSRFLSTTEPAVVTIGKISGGSRPNIIAEKVSMEGTVRTLDKTSRFKVRQLIDRTLKGIVTPHNAEYSLDYRIGTPPLYNHPELASILQPTLMEAAGAENVLSLSPQMTAEDFAAYAQIVPGFYFLLGVRSPDRSTAAPLHSPEFNPDERSITIGIRVMCHLLLDCLEFQDFPEHPPY
jgi:amidohydrolase